MNMRTWCELTGWPYDEWMALDFDTAVEIWSLYGLTWDIVEL